MKKSIICSLALLAAACAREPDIDTCRRDGETVRIGFSVTAPDMQRVVARSVDPDGLGIQSLVLLCFDRDGCFISRVTPSSVTVDADYLGGRLSAEVPRQTQILHFLANQNLDATFNDMENLGRHEHSVLLGLLSTSHRIVYWGRESCLGADNSEGDLAAYLADRTVVLYRNMAKITVVQGTTVHPDTGEPLTVPFVLDGLAVCNQHSFGTVAPFDVEARRFSWTPTSFYVTLPADSSKSSDPEEVVAQQEEYVFEHANSSSDQLYVIVRGRNEGDAADLYYRILLLDSASQEPLPIVRNHNYRIVITGELSGGSATFAEAKTAPPVNNVWISIEQEIPTVSDGVVALSVDRTVVVCRQQTSTEIAFTCTGTDGVAPSLRWVTNGVSATNTFGADSYSFDPATGRGIVRLALHTVADGEMRSGELLIKYGKLYRTVKIFSLSAFDFTPCWATTNVNGAISGGDDTRQEVILMFSVPENFPSELLPLDVFVSANQLDAARAQNLRVVFRQDYLAADGSLRPEWGTDTPGWDYKYVYTVTEERLAQSHMQRIFFRTSLNADSEHLTGKIYVEHPYFNPVEKDYTFTLSSAGAIRVERVAYDAERDVNRLFVAPKKDEPVCLAFTLPAGIAAANRFYICSEYLSAYAPGEEPMPTDGTIAVVNENEWGSTGRMLLFTPNSDRVNSPDGNPATPVTLDVCLKTDRAAFGETVRIACAPALSEAALDYKSTTFELTPYAPFVFDLTVNGQKVADTDYSDVGTAVDVAFDLRDYVADDGVRVTPAGREFVCYIDAPMLRLPDNHAANVREMQTGRFAYTVAADASPGRVHIPFVTRSIVTEGPVRISSDAAVVRFGEEQATIRNNRLRGQLTYTRSGFGLSKPVPADAFVVLEREDGTRIGAVTMEEEGRYSLRLRSEYAYTWSQTQIRVYYRISEGADRGTYALRGLTLAALAAAPDLELSYVE